MNWDLAPGSDEAINAGCLCPMLDNGHGRGCGAYDRDGTPLYYITGGCPLHDPDYKEPGLPDGGER